MSTKNKTPALVCRSASRLNLKISHLQLSLALVVLIQVALLKGDPGVRFVHLHGEGVLYTLYDTVLSDGLEL